jgi:hypothetical protein
VVTGSSLGRWLAGGAILAVAIAVGAPSVVADPIALLWYVTYALTGTVLVVQRPGNAIGWLLLVIMLGFMGATDLAPAEIAALEAGDVDPGWAVHVWIGAISGTWVFLGFAALALILPTGQLPIGRWRAPALGLLALNVVLAVLTAFAPRISVTVDAGARTVFVPNPFAVEPDSPFWTIIPDTDIFFVPVLALLALGVISIVVRYLRSTGLVRLQLRWIVAALTFTVVAVLFGFASLVIGGALVEAVAWVPATLAFLTIPLAIMIAVLRYRLLEIDRIVSRTIGWTLATGVLVALFVGGTLALQSVLVGVTQGETIAVAGSTLLAAVVFQPARRRIQRAVDRWFDRSRYDQELVVTSFGSRLRDELDLPMLRRALIDTSDLAVRPVSVDLWLRGDHGPP